MKFKDFLVYYNIKNKETRRELKKAFKVISNPCNIIIMIKLNELGLTPITAVVSELEQVVDCSNTWTRQVIGRMITFVMKQFGYKSDGKRHRIKESVYKSTYFKTGTLYIKDKNMTPKYKVKAKVEKINIKKENNNEVQTLHTKTEIETN